VENEMKMIVIVMACAAFLLFSNNIVSAEDKPKPGEIKAVYLGSPQLYSKKKIAELEEILENTGANGIVVDFKDSNSLSQEYLAKLIGRFKARNVYVIARIVVFQDSHFARRHPEIAVKNSSGAFWYSGRKDWKRYWLDPASELAQDYNIEIAKRAIDAGADEIQFDYIRFPTDGNMKDIVFPVFDPRKTTKAKVMELFFQKLRRELKKYKPDILLGIDLFGEVFLYGREEGIGQTLSHVAEYFDILCPMAYPSHYRCGEFGVRDPTAHPRKVYHATLSKGLDFLKQSKAIVRPWIQDFSIGSIYGCGPAVRYGRKEIADQIEASRNLEIKGFMLWNVRSNFTLSAFD